MEKRSAIGPTLNDHTRRTHMRRIATTWACAAMIAAVFGSSRAIHAAPYGGSPYSGSPITVPGRIQAADFDNGGEGVAYHDSGPNTNAGGAYRSTGVDITTSSEGGYTIGWIAPGEWVNYTVNVASSGTYKVQLRIAAAVAGGVLHVGFNGSPGSWTAVNIPLTGGWQTWTSVEVPLTLTAGVQQMTLLFDIGGYNISYVDVLSSGSVTPAPAPAPSGSTPYSGSPAAIPGTIQAADYDNGGEGIAYHDSGPDNAGGAYRAGGVDLAASTEGGYTIGWIVAGEWTRYTVNVAAAGSYTAQIRVAGMSDGGLHIGLSGSGASTAVSIPATGGWQSWMTVSVPMTLAAGQQVMTLQFDTGGYNVSYVRFLTASTSTPPPTPAPAPSGSGPAAPNSPNPPPGVLGVTVKPNLSWQAGGATSYDVYLSTSNPPSLYVSNISDWWFGPPGSLSTGTTYYWQIVAKNGGGSTPGPVWYFTTEGTSSTPAPAPAPAPSPSGPAAPANPNPPPGIAGVTVKPNLTWQASGATSYDVYIGTTNPPALSVSNITDSWYGPPGSLSNGTTYYWQVVAKNSGGSTQGPIWNFKTEGTSSTPAPAPAPAPTPPPSTGNRFRMATWNINAGFDVNHTYNLPQQMSFIAGQGIDVLVLQEVQTWDEYQPTIIPALLQQYTGQTWYNLWIPTPGCATAGCLGEMILSRIPISATSTTFLAPSSAGRALIYVGGVPINVLTTHLEFYNTSLRTQQLYDFMSFARNFGGPRLAGGDFNSWWGEWWILQMESKYHDTWFDVTHVQDGAYTTGAVRFDYIFRSFDGDWRVTPTNAFVIGTSLSDHRPFVGDFTVQ